jgi:Zn2+/Cd2+-exporting ATPase
MSIRHAPAAVKESDPAKAGDFCLVETVAEALAQEPALEAVKVDRQDQSVSVATLGPVDAAAIEKSVSERVRELRDREGLRHCGLLEGSSDCSTCPTPVRDEIKRGLTIQHQGSTTTIARVTCPTAPSFWRWRVIPLPKLVPREVRLPEEDDHENEWKWQLAAAAACGVLAVAAHFAPPGPGQLSLVLYLLSYLAGAWFTVHEVWERLRERTLDVHFLMLAVAAGSASIGAWGEGAMLLFLFSLSGALEHFAMGRTSREIRSLFKSAPKTATRLDIQGRETICPVEEIEPGMRLLIKPGEQFPVDAEVVRGSTASDESNLTGEATPVEKKVGDAVLAGTLNLWGAAEVVVQRRASQSALQRIIQMIKEAQHLKAPSQRFTDKFGTSYTYLILALTMGMFFVWWLGFGNSPFVSTDDGRSAFYKSMTLLVVASPCALVLSIPSAVLASIAWAARRGILFRGGAAVENLAEISIVAMDKTGTLTTGELKVERIESFPAGREGDVAQLAYSLEKLSNHPLARAITRHGKQQQLKPLPADRLESVTGSGIEASIEGRLVRLGKRDWLAHGPHAAEIHVASPAGPGVSEVWIVTEGLTGRVLLRDDIRPQARSVVEKLRELGLRSVVLTGDRHATGEYLRQQLAVDEVRAELKPDQKVEAIRSLTAQRNRVAMIGDGVNDAPSLAAADVGVAMGARGSDAALEQAEVVLMHDRLENFLTAFQLSQRARRIIWQNLVISLGTVMVLVGCALLGAIPLTLGVLGHEGSTVIVVLNSLRLLFARDGAGRS